MPAASAPPPAGGNWQAAPPVAVVAGPAPGIAYADLTTRVIAFIIDGILLGILSAFISLALGALLLGFLLSGGFVGVIIATVLLSAATLFLSAIYFVWGWTNPAMRASLGQRALNLQTVNAADGATLTREQALLRWGWLYGVFVLASVVQLVLTPTDLSFLGSLVSLATFAYFVFLIWTTSKDPKRQGYHDVKASTVVVKRVA
jgi:uncharacterized RDD family membrane protein YckC